MSFSKRHAYVTLLDLQVLQSLVADGVTRLLVAVSGGADSVALLRALYGVREGLGLHLEVAHFDHGLREDSGQDSQFVRALCDALGVGFYGETMAGENRPGGVSPEAFWRDRRYEFFAKVYRGCQADALALGHTLDDMAETFLYHVVRGSGAEGARFEPVKEFRGMRIVRPLWRTQRVKIEEILTAQGQEWREDLTNQDTRFSRNLIRCKVMPALREINPDASGAIARFCDAVGSSGKMTEFEDLPEKLGIDDVVAYDAATQGRLLRAYIMARGGQAPSQKQLQQAVGMLSKRKSGLVSLSENRTLVIDQLHGWLYAGNEPSDKQLAMYVGRREKRILAEVRGTLSLGEGERRLQLLSGEEIAVSGADVPECCGVRNRREGDRLGRRLLKKLLIARRVPWYLRDYLVFYVDEGDTVIGVLGNDDLGLGGLG